MIIKKSINKIFYIIKKIYKPLKANYDFNKHIKHLNVIRHQLIKKNPPNQITSQYDKPIIILTGTHMEKRGLMGNVSIFIEWIYYAIKNNYDVSIDLKYCKNQIISSNEKGKINGWDLFFKQPFNISIDDALLRKNIIYIETHGIDGINPKKSLNPNLINIPKIDYNNEASVKLWKSLLSKSMAFNDKTLNYCESLYDSIIQPNQKVLGVLLRGTDYIKLQPYGHPIQPTKEIAFEKILEKCKLEKINCIFLATEDVEIYNYINTKCIENKISCIVNPNSGLFNISYNKQLYQIYEKEKKDVYSINLNYLANIFILANCYSLISGNTSATKFIRILNRILSDNNECKPFHSEYIFELGHYGI